MSRFALLTASESGKTLFKAINARWTLSAPRRTHDRPMKPYLFRIAAKAG